MSVEDSRRVDAALEIMYHMCKVAILAAAGPGNGRGEDAIRWWLAQGSKAPCGWKNQAAIIAMAVGYAAGHLEKQDLEFKWQEAQKQ